MPEGVKSVNEEKEKTDRRWVLKTKDVDLENEERAEGLCLEGL